MPFRDWQWQCNDAYSQSHVGHVLVTKLCVYNVLRPELRSEPGNTAESVRYSCKKTNLWLKDLDIKVRMCFLCFVLRTKCFSSSVPIAW